MGDRFSDAKHPYAADLDLFGHASLFQLLNSARTFAGEERLADWLRHPAPAAEVGSRNEAVAELRPLLDLREKLAVLGDDFRTGVHPERLSQWGAAPPQPFPVWQRFVAFILSILAAVTLLWWFGTRFVDVSATRSLIAVAFAAAALAAPQRNRVLGIVGAIQEPAHDLDLLSGILAILEKEKFHSAKLLSLQKQLTPAGQPASQRIARLRRLMELLDSRDSVFVRMFGPVLLWTTQLAMALEAWRTENGALVRNWLAAVAEIEALSSLAGYSWEHPSDPFPEIVEGAVLQAEQIAHPLLPASRAVANDLTLGAPLRLILVSGSNMSGKSTLLRTIGANAVLAWAGAPVRARWLRISSMTMGASIRTVDSLEEGHSRFMAEILRLKQTLDLPHPSLFLLDELLHGTNSHDRAIGAEGLLRALLAKGAVGIATTHDLALTRVASQLEPAAANFHFDDRLENQRLIFDYKIKAGVVERSNALDLMRAIGLDV
jgi:DNA mismatch repair ATPase MutS